jgi:hypothetical protein
MCGEELVRVEVHTRLAVAVSAADEATSYGQFKRVASEAVRVADMRVVVSEDRRTRQSTLVKYLQLIGQAGEQEAAAGCCIMPSLWWPGRGCCTLCVHLW